MFKKLAILGVLILVLAAAYGAASALIVDGGALQAGLEADLECDADGVKLEYLTNVYGNGEFGLDAVRVTDIDQGCEGNYILASLMAPIGPGGQTIKAFMRTSTAIGTDGTALIDQCYISGWVNCTGKGPYVKDVGAISLLLKNTSE
jgi:hypothetical protein